MPFRKYRADRLFDGYRYREEQVLVTDEEGVIESILPVAEAGEDVHLLEGILSPGMINCHCHLELSHMKGVIPEKTGLVEFVIAVVQGRHYPETEILEAIEKAEDEMLVNGIVAVGDICNNALTIPQKTKGRIYYQNFIEASGFDPAVAETRFRRAVDLFREYGKYYAIPIESNSIVPHAPYSVSAELWERILGFPGNHLLTIHNQETAAENEWFLNKKGSFTDLYQKLNIDISFFQPTGKSSLQSCLTKLLPNQSLLLVHNVYTSADDIQFSRQSTVSAGITWCLCPNANRYITGGLPDVDLLIRNDCKIVLGTDSLASNHQLNLLEEIKTLRQNFPHVPAEEMLKWATSNGAKALQMDPVLGSFEKGKQPGIVLLDKDLTTAQRLL